MTRGTHRRIGAGPVVSEVRRLRAELARVTAERDQLAALLIGGRVALDEDGARLVGGIGYRAGLEDGWRGGYLARAAEDEASWRAVFRPLSPAGERERIDRALRAAEAGERRDQAEHEASFVARARNTHDRDRTDAQRACVQLAPARPGTEAA